MVFSFNFLWYFFKVWIYNLVSVGVCFWGFLRRRISNVGSRSGAQSILFFLPPQAEQSEERIPPCCSSLPPGSCRHAAVPISGNANGSAPPSGWHSDFRCALAPALPPLAIPRCRSITRHPSSSPRRRLLSTALVITRGGECDDGPPLIWNFGVQFGHHAWPSRGLVTIRLRIGTGAHPSTTTKFD